MDIKKILILILIAFNFNAANIPLDKLNFRAASTLPLTHIKGQGWGFILGREAHGGNKGTFDAFGGSRDRGESHPVITASRELTEETVHLMPHAKNKKTAINYLKSNKTQDIIVNARKKGVIYITLFDFEKDVKKLIKNFYKARKKAPGVSREKDAIAFVKLKDLSDALTTSGNKVNAHVFGSGWKKITLRPIFISMLKQFFQDIKNKKITLLNKTTKIRYY